MSVPLGVLLVTDAFPPVCGGSGWSTWELARGLSARGHHVEVVKVDTGAREDRIHNGKYESVAVTTFARAVTDVMAAEELAVLGEVVIEYADIVGDWQRPSFDITASTIGVFAGDDLVAYAERTGHTRGDAAVHPDHQGRGIGTWLAGWLQETARAAGDDVIGMPKPEGSPGDRLLEVTPEGVAVETVRMRVRLLRGDVTEVTMHIQAARGSPAVIGGPRHGDGVLVIIVWANANPQPR